jgi:hypothetical protein
LIVRPPRRVCVVGTRQCRVVVEKGVTDENPTLQGALGQYPDFLDNRFWSDGMIRVIGREFSGLIRSPCGFEWLLKNRNDRRLELAE